MVRNYQRKKAGPAYSKEDLRTAIELIKEKKTSYRVASAQFKIPLGTLSSHVLKSLNINAGRPPALSHDEEKYLVYLISTLQEWGQLSTCADILKYTDEYVEVMDLQARFPCGYPTKDWYYSFLKRWNNYFKVMKSSSLENVRAKSVSLTIIDEWFKTLYDVLKKLGILNKPEHIFNMDESGFAGEAGRRVVVVKRGTKYANQ